MVNKITVALAGLGSRGKDTYAKAAKIHPDKIEIVAIADVNPKKVEMVAEEYHIPKERCYTSAEEMLKEEKLADVMFITTQDRQHVAQAIPLYSFFIFYLICCPFTLYFLPALTMTTRPFSTCFLTGCDSRASTSFTPVT